MSISTLMTALFVRFEWRRLPVRAAFAALQESNLPQPSFARGEAYLNAQLEQVAYGFAVRGLL